MEPMSMHYLFLMEPYNLAGQQAAQERGMSVWQHRTYEFSSAKSLVRCSAACILSQFVTADLMSTNAATTATQRGGGGAMVGA